MMSRCQVSFHGSDLRYARTISLLNKLNMSRILSALKPESLVLLIEDTVTGGDQWKPAFKNGAGDLNSGLKIRRPPADHQRTTIQIPTSVTAASFLKHAALTPAQREFLHTVASSYSTEHVRGLIAQHYLNVLYRCIRADHSPKGDTFLVASVASPENDREDHQSKAQCEHPLRSKQKGKISTNAKNCRKSRLPNIQKRQARPFDTSASERRKVKKWIRSSQTQRRRSPRRARTKLLDEEEEEEGPDDSLSECLSSLSVGEWDGDSLSDL